jgi:hypothetical protein
VLEEFRTEKEKMISAENKKVVKTKKNGVVRNDQPFRFLDLPFEIRNMIYDVSMEDDEEARQSRIRPCDKPERYRYRSGASGSRRRILIAGYSRRDEGKCKIEPTSEQKKQESGLRALFNRVIKRRLNKETTDGLYTAGCREAFEKYEAEHEMYTRRCAHKNHDEEDKNIDNNKKNNTNLDPKHVISINARGNICDDMPMFSLVNRQIFHDTFYLFFSTAREDV